jgi:hypothetical protein
MTKIKFKDLPKDTKISAEEMKHVTGGMLFDLGREGLISSRGLLSTRAGRLKSVSEVDRINLPNMMHDAGP